MACVYRASAGTRKERKYTEMSEIGRQKELVGGQESNRLCRATRNRAWLSSILHCLNGIEMSWEESRDNLCLRYGLMPQDILVTYDGCGKKFLIEHSLSCPKVGFILVWHDNTIKEWGVLAVWALIPSNISYKPQINSRTVQGERTRVRA